MSTNEEIIKVLHKIKQYIKERKREIVPTLKNKQTRRKLKLTDEDVYDKLLELELCDYVSGPEDDRDRKGEFDIWKFGKSYRDKEMYIKIKVDDARVKILSFHEDGMF